MFSKLFKPRWQQRDARSRLAAVKELINQNSDDVRVLMQLALQDDDEGVRNAALHQLSWTQALELASQQSNIESLSALQNYINQGIEHGQLKTENLAALQHQFPRLNLEQRFIEHHPQQEDVNRYIDLALSEQKLSLEQALKYLRRSRHQSIALHLIEKLNDANQLQVLLKQADQFDKRANQMLRDRLRACRESQKADEAVSAQIEKLLQRIEQLARASLHPLFEAEVLHLEQQWSALAQSDSDNALRFNNALKLCREKIEQHKVLPPEIVSAPTPLVNVAEQEIVPSEPLEQKPLVINQAQAQLQQQFNQQFDNQAHKIEQALEARDRKTSAACIHTLRQFIRDQKFKLNPRQHNKIQALQTQLDELEQWQQFAVLPKLEQLCATMQGLATSDLHPKEKAEQIKALQEEWKHLKLPHAEQAQQLWTQFKAAAEVAYAPCATYFATEKNARANNLAQRVSICESLESYFTQQNWAQADWRAVEKLIDTAIKEFARFYPVERGDEKPIKQRFDLTLKSIKDQLYQEYRRVESAKKECLSKANELLASHNAIDAAKQMQQLQQQWKTIGNGKHHVDQNLWHQFQELGNQIFAKRRDYFDQKHIAEDETVKLANALCEQLSVLVHQDDQQIHHTKQELSTLKQRFNALSLPEKQRQALQRQFRDALNTVQKHLDDFPRREKAKTWQELSELAEICQQLEHGPAPELIPDLQNRWQVQPDSANKKLLTARYQFAVSVAQGKNTIDFDAIYQQRRELCVQIEISLGLDSPEEDRELRKALQLSSLTRKFEQTKLSTEHLFKQWWLMPSALNFPATKLNDRVKNNLATSL